MFDGFQLCGSFQPITVGEHLIKAGIGHLVVLLTDGAWVTSLPGTLHFCLHLVADRLPAATTVWSHAVPPVVFMVVILFQRLALVLLLATHCLLLVVCCLLSTAGCCVADRIAPHRADRDCLTGM